MSNSFIKEEKNMNWNWLEIVYTFIGSFLGFCFALATEGLISYWLNKRAKMRLFSNLKDELKNTILASYKGKEETHGVILFELPVWTAITQSDNILFLKKMNATLYDSIIAIYNGVFAIKRLEENFNNNENVIFEKRMDTVDKITKLLEDINIWKKIK